MHITLAFVVRMPKICCAILGMYYCWVQSASCQAHFWASSCVTKTLFPLVSSCSPFLLWPPHAFCFSAELFRIPHRGWVSLCLNCRGPYLEYLQIHTEVSSQWSMSLGTAWFVFHTVPLHIPGVTVKVCSVDLTWIWPVTQGQVWNHCLWYQSGD